MEKSRTQKSLINVAFSLGSQGVELILKVVGRTIFIRYLAIEYLGVNGLFGEILTVLSLAELGVGSALGYALYKPLREDNKPRIAALMELYRKSYFAIGVSVAVVGAVLIPFLKFIVKDPGEIGKQLVPIYLFYLFNTSITYFYSYKGSLLNADQKNYIVQTIKECSNIARTALQIVVLVIWRNFYAYLLIESVCIFANNIVVSRFVDKKYRYIKTLKGKEKLDKQSIKQIVNNVKALFITKVSTILVNSTDNTIISAICGIVITGYYSNYVMFTTLIFTVLSQLFSSLYPSIGNLNAEGDRAHSRLVFDGLMLSSFWLFSIAAIGLFVMVNDVIWLWLGEARFVLPAAIVVIVSVNIYMRGVHSDVWLFKDSFGLFVYGQYMTFFTAVLNIVLSFVFGKALYRFGANWSLFGILLATAVSRILTNTWYDPWMLFKHGFKQSVLRFYAEYLGYAVLLVATGFVTYIVAGLVPVTGWPTLFAKFVITLVLPNIIYLALFFKSRRFQYIKERLLSVFRKKAG
ncbi:MAG TPA: hypothetical protein DEW35_02050 [Ruminococcaceae bacterium]|nr:hypothetical protein [Oscillospiraceae bacterium]